MQISGRMQNLKKITNFTKLKKFQIFRKKCEKISKSRENSKNLTKFKNFSVKVANNVKNRKISIKAKKNFKFQKCPKFQNTQKPKKLTSKMYFSGGIWNSLPLNV